MKLRTLRTTRRPDRSRLAQGPLRGTLQGLLRGLRPGPVLGLVLLASLAGCGRDDAAPASGDASVPVRGGTLVVGVDSDPGTLNPVLRSTSLAGSILGVVNRGLVRMNARFEFELVIAHRLEWSDDGLQLTFHLRSDVKWSDGAPFVARDIEATYELFTDDRVPTPRRSDFAPIASVEAIDDTTVVFAFTERGHENLFATAFQILPAHVIDTLDPAEIQSWEINRRPIGCGPYQVVEWASNDRIVLERNPHYWLEPGHLDRIVFKVIPEESARLLQLEIGEIDFLDSVPSKEIERLRAKPEVVLHQLGPRNLGYLVHNLQRPLLADARVRNAISYAIDRRAFIDGLLFGYGERLAHAVTPLMGWAYDASLPPHDRDLDRARELLADAGWEDTDGDGIVDRDGVPLRLEVKTRTGDPVRENGVLVLKSNLRAVGIDVVPRMLELSTALEQVRAGDFDIYMGQMAARLSPDLTYTFGTDGGFNYGKYSDARVDSLLLLARQTVDRGQASPLYRQVQAIVYAAQPMTMLYATDPPAGVRVEVKNATPSFLSPYDDIHRWWKQPAAKPARRP